MDFHIEQAEVELIRSILSVMLIIIPAIFGFIFWLIRKVDVGGQRRLDKCVEENASTIKMLQDHVNAMDCSVKEYLEQRDALRGELDHYKNLYITTDEKFMDLKKRFDELLDQFEKLRYTISANERERKIYHIDFFMKAGLTREQAEKLFSDVTQLSKIEGKLDYNGDLE